MRFAWRGLLAGFVALCGLASCEEEFDANADYKETAIIYALLDSSRPVQYVKVTKAFVNTNTDAYYIAANHPDSSRLDSSRVTVVLNRLSPTPDSSVLASYSLKQMPVLDKEEGIFSTAGQYVFASDSNQIALQDNQLYQVVVTNKVSGKQYKAATRIVNKVCIKQVGYNALTQPCDPNASPAELAPHRFQNLRFDLVPNGEIYKATYYIVYKEFHNGAAPDQDTIVFDAVNNYIKRSTTPGTHLRVIDPFEIYQQMINKIDTANDGPDTYRTMEPGYVKVTGGGTELARYIEVNNAYSAILQSRPEYTNIQNGAGLFSSRNTQTVRTYFTADAIDTLIVRYPDLKFRD